MRRNIRTIVVFSVMYGAFVAVGLGPLFGAGGFNDVTFGIGLVIAVALFPVTAIVLTMFGPLLLRDRPDDTHLPRAARRIASPVAERDHFDFTFAAWNGIESTEAVARLSRRLHALDIAHCFADGEINVTDSGVRWKVAPVVGTPRIAGWVEAQARETRAMIEAAVEEFLIDELGLRLERLAA